jgi:photosystem II stability/assembly factor-like uncharacterized protein
MKPHRVYVGTVGQGVFRSLDGGQTFRRACEGMPFMECSVRALALDPRDSQILYVGSELGLFVSRDGAESWQRLPAPLDGMQIWSLHLDARRPGRILVGACPSRLFRSEDDGRTWTEADAPMRRDCPRILHTRVTCLAADNTDPDLLWAGVEIDGVYRSSDGGRTWRSHGKGLSSQDIHALAVLPARDGRPPRMLAATNNDLNRSDDGGATWTPLKIGERLPWGYCRALAQPLGQLDVVLLGTGDGPPGGVGGVGVSRDGGATWRLAELPGVVNSTMWNFALHPAEPRRIYATSISGQLYRSDDGGATWGKQPREFGEVRALAWAPM